MPQTTIKKRSILLGSWNNIRISVVWDIEITLKLAEILIHKFTGRLFKIATLHDQQYCDIQKGKKKTLEAT
jgi:hypothetical protein